MVKITNVNVVLRNRGEGSGVLAFADVVLDDSFVVRNIKILKAKNREGYLLSFPSQQTRESKKWYDVCFPINNEVRKYFEEVIFNTYEKLLEAQPT
jgi:DNA-binding cell septation regulator SpoVG